MSDSDQGLRRPKSRTAAAYAVRRGRCCRASFGARASSLGSLASRRDGGIGSAFRSVGGEEGHLAVGLSHVMPDVSPVTVGAALLGSLAATVHPTRRAAAIKPHWPSASRIRSQSAPRVCVSSDVASGVRCAKSLPGPRGIALFFQGAVHRRRSEALARGAHRAHAFGAVGLRALC